MAIMNRSFSHFKETGWWERWGIRAIKGRAVADATKDPLHAAEICYNARRCAS